MTGVDELARNCDGSAPDDDTMRIEVEPWGGIAVMWLGGRATLLVDCRDAWLAWDGRLVRRVPTGAA